jgi:4-hydroxy-tetrahydrodipicolinate synthase
MARLGGLMTAMVTPFTAGDEVDYGKAAELAKHLIECGNDGLIITGTTGEGPTLNADEKVELWRATKQAVGPDHAIVAGTGSYSTRESIHYTELAELAGADACLLVVPYYNNPSQEGLYQHFKAIANSTSLPCILYNVPSRAPRNLDAATLKRLAEIDNIVGLKEASGNLSQISAVLGAVPPDFLVYSGNDGDTFTIMSLGGYGVISVSAHLVGAETRRMMDLLVAGHVSEAAAIHHKLLPLVDALFWQPNPMPVKAALNELGFQVGKPRLPLVDLNEAEKDRLRTVLGRYQLDTYLSKQAVAA